MDDIIKNSITVVYGRVEHIPNGFRVYPAMHGFIMHDGDVILKNTTKNYRYTFYLSSASNIPDGARELMPGQSISIIKKYLRNPFESEYAEVSQFQIHSLDKSEIDERNKKEDASKEAEEGKKKDDNPTTDDKTLTDYIKIMATIIVIVAVLVIAWKVIKYA